MCALILSDIWLVLFNIRVVTGLFVSQVIVPMPSFDSQTKKPLLKTQKDKEKVRRPVFLRVDVDAASGNSGGGCKVGVIGGTGGDGCVVASVVIVRCYC